MKEKKQPADTSITFKATKAFKEDLQKMSEITGRKMTDIIVKAISKELSHYRNENGYGRVKPVPAYRLTGISEYEKRIALIEGETSISPGKHECFVLDDTTINPRQPYYKIYDCESGQIISVPKEHIEFKVEKQGENQI